MRRQLLMGCVSLVLMAVPAHTQSSLPQPPCLGTRPAVGSVGIAAPTQRSLISGTADVLRHRDSGGKPCLTVGGYARAFTTNRALYDHVIIATNQCIQVIKLQVCYYRTQQC